MRRRNKIFLTMLIALLCVVLFIAHFGTRSGVTDAQVSESLPGDEVFLAPWITIDRAGTMPASASTTWPWVAQLGYERGGWYAPLWLENLLHLYAASSTHPEFQALSAGQIVPDFGGGRLKVLAVVPGEYIEYASIAPSAATTTTDYMFTWTLMLEDNTPSSTSFHLRLRLPKPSRYAWVPPSLPGMFDYLTDIVMFAGLKENLQHSK